MRNLADMGVDVRLIDWLRRHGHDAKHLRDEGLHRMPNGEIFAKAISENRTIITFDLDFGEIVALAKKGLEEIDEADYRHTLRDLILKKRKEIKPETEVNIREKILTFAQGKGYEIDLILTALKELKI